MRGPSPNSPLRGKIRKVVTFTVIGKVTLDLEHNFHQQKRWIAGPAMTIYPNVRIESLTSKNQVPQVVSVMLSIIVPSWNNLPYLKLCLESLAKNSVLDNEIHVHVNDGGDGTLEWVREHGIKHTHTPTNVGICEAVNTAAENCAGDYLVYLNDDMYVLPHWDRLLYERVTAGSGREPRVVSGTMVQVNSIAPSSVIADYGPTPTNFDEEGLLRDFRRGVLDIPDWNGATWPPCCLHRKWWEAVSGYSVELSPGFYSDIDFSMKLWHIGCRHFQGVGSSLVYHFGERTTCQIRGPKNRNVKLARQLFFKKWGVMPSTFKRYYLRCSEPFCERIPELDWSGARLERARLALLSVFTPRLPSSDKSSRPTMLPKAA